MGGNWGLEEFNLHLKNTKTSGSSSGLMRWRAKRKGGKMARKILWTIVYTNLFGLVGYHVLNAVGLFIRLPFWDVVWLITAIFSPFNVKFYLVNAIAFAPGFISLYILMKTEKLAPDEKARENRA